MLLPRQKQLKQLPAKTVCIFDQPDVNCRGITDFDAILYYVVVYQQAQSLRPCITSDKMFTTSYPKPSLKIGSVKKSFFCFNIDNGLKYLFLGSKLFCFSRQKVEIFSISLKKELCETSQNFNSIRHPIEKMKITIV